MQGTVFGSLMCTATMDKLGKLSYNNEDLLYKYRGVVDVPVLGMVDDILSIQKCSKSGKANAHINSFIEAKKLKFSEAKCARIHVGKRQRPCKPLKVHEEKMINAENGKYLGDIVSCSGCVKQTVAERVSKGYGIVSEIKAILEEIPLGKYKVDMGLKLRQSLLINGILFNSEIWHSVTAQEIQQLEKIDNMLLRYLLGCPAKTATEFLYLETGSVPLRYIIASRRLNYLHTVVSRHKDEVTRKILQYQFEHTVSGDFSELVKKDLELIELPPELEKIREYDRFRFKKMVKDRIRAKALHYLKERQKDHSKIRNIQYETLQAQSYLSSPLFTNNESKLIALLRSRMHSEFKSNFSHMYQGQVYCPLKCSENQFSDTQEHLLVCTKVTSNFTTNSVTEKSTKVDYCDIYKDCEKSLKQIAVLFTELIKVRQKLIDFPDNLDPCTDPITSCAMSMHYLLMY